MSSERFNVSDETGDDDGDDDFVLPSNWIDTLRAGTAERPHSEHIEYASGPPAHITVPNTETRLNLAAPRSEYVRHTDSAYMASTSAGDTETAVILRAPQARPHNANEGVDADGVEYMSGGPENLPHHQHFGFADDAGSDVNTNANESQHEIQRAANSAEVEVARLQNEEIGHGFDMSDSTIGHPDTLERIRDDYGIDRSQFNHFEAIHWRNEITLQRTLMASAPMPQQTRMETDFRMRYIHRGLFRANREVQRHPESQGQIRVRQVINQERRAAIGDQLQRRQVGSNQTSFDDARQLRNRQVARRGRLIEPGRGAIVREPERRGRRSLDAEENASVLREPSGHNFDVINGTEPLTRMPLRLSPTFDENHNNEDDISAYTGQTRALDNESEVAIASTNLIVNDEDEVFNDVRALQRTVRSTPFVGLPEGVRRGHGYDLEVNEPTVVPTPREELGLYDNAGPGNTAIGPTIAMLPEMGSRSFR